jgi:hypothetical protein
MEEREGVKRRYKVATIKHMRKGEERKEREVMKRGEKD